MAKVTVFIPVYNAEKYLKETIESILNQSFEDFELLLINDGSTDSSVEIINSFDDKRIRLINNDKNMGLPFTRNRALGLIESEYIALMDSDDIAHKNRLKEEVKFLDKNRDIDVVGSDFVMFFPDGKKKYVKTPSNPEYIRTYLMFNICIANPSTMIRNSFIKKYNLRYREDFFVCQDYSFWIDVCQNGKISNINKPFLYYRSGHDNISKRSSERKAEQRKKLLDQIHIRALNQNNLSLSNNEIILFNDIFCENIKNNISLLEANKIKDIITNLKKQNNIINKNEFNKAIIQVWYLVCRNINSSIKNKIRLYLSIDRLNLAVLKNVLKIIVKTILK